MPSENKSEWTLNLYKSRMYQAKWFCGVSSPDHWPDFSATGSFTEVFKEGRAYIKLHIPDVDPKSVKVYVSADYAQGKLVGMLDDEEAIIQMFLSYD